MYASKKREFSVKIFLAVSILPFLALFCIFYIYPLIKGFFNSLYIWSGVSEVMKYVGLRNYKELLTDTLLLKALKNDFIILFFKEIFILIPSLFFAIAISRLAFRKAERSFYRIIFYFPNIVSIVIIAIIWSFIYHPSIGILNSGLQAIGLQDPQNPIAWLGDPSTVIGAIIPVTVWCAIGFFMILFIAGIHGIPGDLFEASVIDGASEWRQIVSITIPLLWEHIKFAVVSIMFTTISGNFSFVQIMTNGGPMDSSQVLGFHMWESAFRLHRVGYASTIGVFMLVLAIVLTLLSQNMTQVEVEE